MFDLNYMFNMLQHVLQRFGVVAVSQGEIIVYYSSLMDIVKLDYLTYLLEDLAISCDEDSTYNFTSYDGEFPDFKVSLYEVQDFNFDL